MEVKIKYKYVSDKFGSEELTFNSVEEFEKEASYLDPSISLRMQTNRDLSIDWVDQDGDVILEEIHEAPEGCEYCLFSDPEGELVIVKYHLEHSLQRVLSAMPVHEHAYTGVWDTRAGMYVRDDC